MADGSSHEGSAGRVLTRSLLVRRGSEKDGQVSTHLCAHPSRTSPPPSPPPVPARFTLTPSPPLAPPSFSIGPVWPGAVSVWRAKEQDRCAE